MTLPIDPTLVDLLQEVQRAGAALLHTSLPGEVLSYDRSEQTAVVKLVIRGRRRSLRTGNIESYEFKPLARVPVVWPGGGGGSLTFDLAKGDRVVVIFAERDISRWLATGNAPSDPADVRRHATSDAIAIPQINPYTDPLDSDAVLSGATVLKADDIRLGASTASSLIALAPLVLAELQKLTSWMSTMKSAFDAHTHLSAAPASPTGVPGVSVPPTFAPASPVADSPASSKVRSE